MKICPFCSEEIQESAILCRYCHSTLETKEIKESANMSNDQNNSFVIMKSSNLKNVINTSLILYLIGTSLNILRLILNIADVPFSNYKSLYDLINFAVSLLMPIAFVSFFYAFRKSLK